MPFTRSTTIRLIRIAAVILLAATIVVYAVFRSLNYARGPEIEVMRPADGSPISASTVVVSGRAERVNSLTLDGREISVDKEGDFSETLVVFPGLNIITVAATDQFGRSTSKELRMVGLAEFPSPIQKQVQVQATSTATSTAR